jgi:hypothetical protein
VRSIVASLEIDESTVGSSSSGETWFLCMGNIQLAADSIIWWQSSVRSIVASLEIDESTVGSSSSGQTRIQLAVYLVAVILINA